ncbi:MAG: phage holin family protein [Gemmataceae bacterium]
MLNEMQAPPQEGSTTSLLRGIINDIGDLVRHEISFAHTEIKTDLRKASAASTVLGLGVGSLFLGAILVALMLVHLVHWFSFYERPVDAALPLWGAYGIVSLIFLGVGAVGSYVGCQMFNNFNPLPDQTAQSVKENVEWIANSK